MEWFYVLIIFLLISIIVTYLFKRFFGAQTYYIASLIKTKKANKYFDKFSKHERTINFLSELGLVLGFGAIAVDYLHGKGESTARRIFLFVFSTFALYVFFELLLGWAFTSSPFMKPFSNIFGFFNLFSFVFGLTGFAGFVLITLIFSSAEIIVKTFFWKVQACPGVAPLIPGVDIPNVPIKVPLHVWLVLFIILVVHEGFHGITARKEKIKINSSGLLLLGFLPIGAFVEPDEIQLKKVYKKSALKIFAAGPLANLASIPVFLLIGSVIALVFFAPFAGWAEGIHDQAVLGVKISGVDKNTGFCGDLYPSPAYGVLEKGMTIKEINGKKILTMSDLTKALLDKNKSYNFVLETKKGEIIEKTLKKNKMGKFGFISEEIPNPAFTAPLSYEVYSSSSQFLGEFFYWLAIISLLVAIVNFLPVEPFDGGKIAKIIYSSYMPASIKEGEREKIIEKFFIFIVLILIILNAIPLFM